MPFFRTERRLQINIANPLLGKQPNKNNIDSEPYMRIRKVFMRIIANRKNSEKHFRRIEEFAPKTGTVRMMRLTERQYANIYIVSGNADLQEKEIWKNCQIML